MGLDRMGVEDDDDDDDEGDTDDDTAAAAPNDATEEGNAAPKEEDLEILILGHEFPEALEVILPDEEPESPSETPQLSLFTKLTMDYEESPSRENDGV
jgi:hypothetical protein